MPDAGAAGPAAGTNGVRGLRRWTRNPWAWAAVAFTTVLQVSIDYLPPIARVLQLVPLGVRDWGLIALLAVAPALIATTVLHLQRAVAARRAPREERARWPRD